MWLWEVDPSQPTIWSIVTENRIEMEKNNNNKLIGMRIHCATPKSGVGHVNMDEFYWNLLLIDLLDAAFMLFQYFSAFSV